MRLKYWVLFFLAVSPLTSVTGPPAPDLAPYDSFMTQIMTKYDIPAAELAVSRNGKLVLERGYGVMDEESKTPVQPDALFRIASLSKPLTAVTVLQLADQGRIKLDDPAFSYLTDLQPPPGEEPDPRLMKVTVRNLLQHSGGWDRDRSPDPMFQSVQIAKAFNKEPPATADDIIRYTMGRPLDFDPGARYAYSNFGYAALGRVIERVTGTPYADYVKANVLAPLGIDRMQIGHTLQEDRLPGEVTYPTPGYAPSVFKRGPRRVPWQYGGWYLEAMDAHGGWVACAPDLLRFLNAIDGRRGGPLLSSKAIAEMTARPALPKWESSQFWYGLGFFVRPSGQDSNWWHDGAMDGSRTLMVRAYNGFAWVALFNKRTVPDFESELDSGLWKTLSQIRKWSETDLFGLAH